MSIISEMMSYPFIVRALIGGVLVSLCASLLGVSLVLKRYSMIGDGLSHVSFGALSVALDADWIELLSQKLIGCRFEPEYIFLKLQKLSFNQTQSQILSDICSLMRQQNSPDSH